MIFLGVYNLLSLLLPRLQGIILDAVVNDRRSKFNANVLFYLYVSLGTGFFGGLQSLCFSIVGRKIAKTVRCRLFRGIVLQVLQSSPLRGDILRILLFSMETVVVNSHPDLQMMLAFWYVVCLVLSLLSVRSSLFSL